MGELVVLGMALALILALAGWLVRDALRGRADRRRPGPPPG